MTKAFVLINADTGVEGLLHEEIKALDGVKEVYELYGEYDIMAVVEEPDEKEVQRVVSWELRKIKGVRSTNTMVVAR
ncbi:Lrp/AsnC ligand binding domain-containing protein [Nitrososphaera viennensis]|jgi:DNA-binding Lrp family transcriptional regulator|uniref:Lrp/AsnC ligand binding domain-containing protein n=2 Tax=Nitrososphaera viennensis TaxID=1034015 RepID=A0A977ICI4_9ARCH|nr:Lrp/AsnC ligand binding domain-containing protein [Nitrososphaera viennensis]AIC16326.1 putative transcriptional regulator, AsnC family [Nitrososphaera viennensis EN76]UVS68262.1 Lrp/AsnC ligand binding domain-containing protein [Nitrososphaera viennensis]